MLRSNFLFRELNSRACHFAGRERVSESQIMSKGNNQRSHREAKKPKKDSTKDKAAAAAEARKSSISIGGRKMKS